MAARGAQPRITWGSGFANQIDFSGPVGGALNYSLPSRDSEFTEAPSGEADAWIEGQEQFLEVTVRWIPITNTTVPFVATGWDGSTGWRAFLEWARQMNVFRWIPDKTVPATYYTMYLVEPLTDPGVQLERGNRHRSLRLLMRTSDRTVVTGY